MLPLIHHLYLFSRLKVALSVQVKATVKLSITTKIDSKICKTYLHSLYNLYPPPEEEENLRSILVLEIEFLDIESNTTVVT